MDEFRALLDRFWIRREEDRELFYQVRRKLPALRRALREQFGWEVICTEQVIRLVKEPARAQEAFGIPEFTEVQDYCLLCGVLLLLEDKDDGQRFLLSELTQAVLAYTKPYLPDLSWERYSCRTSLVRVLQYAERLGCCAALRGKATALPPTRTRKCSMRIPGCAGISACIFIGISPGMPRCGILKIRPRTVPIRSGAPSAPGASTGSWRWPRRSTGRTPAIPSMPISRISGASCSGIWTKPSAANCRSIITVLFPAGGRRALRQLLSPGPDAQRYPVAALRAAQRKNQLWGFPRDPDDRVHLTREAFSRELEALRQEYKNQWGKTVAEKDLAALTQEILEELCYWDFAAVQGEVVTLQPGFALWQGIYPQKR